MMIKDICAIATSIAIAVSVLFPAHSLAQSSNSAAELVPVVSLLLDGKAAPIVPYTPAGKVTYDRVPTVSSPPSLDFGNTVPKPVRGATVQLLSTSNVVVETTVTDNNGDYSFTAVQTERTRIRVRAELLKTMAAPTFDVKVVDNTNSNALYTLTESSPKSTAVRNLHASSGFVGGSYTGTRAAGPFAILDTIFEAINDIVTVDGAVVFPPLQVNWSINNVPVSGDLTAGQIGTSFYNNSNLFILGKENNDTDEFDDHIIVHEWGHYFEDKLSRSDSVGGNHEDGDRLDMRVAFGEGFGNALSGIILDEPIYVDTSGQDQNGGFIIDMEANPTGVIGWFSEASIQSLLFDLFDANADGADAVALGFGPIYNVLVNEQKNSEVFTSMFSFASALKANNAGQAAAISTLLDSQSIVGSTIDSTGSTETNDAGQGMGAVLPVYTTLAVNSPAITLCTSTNFNGANDSNKLSNFRYLTLNIATSGFHTVSMARVTPLPSYGDTDPDFKVFQNGVAALTGSSEDDNSESASGFLNAGNYAMHITDQKISTGSRGTACFEISLTQDPA